MLRILLTTTFVVSNFAFSAAIHCSDGQPEGKRFAVITNTKVLDSEKAAFIEKMDVVGEYPQLLGLFGRNVRNGAVDLTFAEAKEVEWSQVDKKACFVRLGDYVIVRDLKRNTKNVAGDYLAEYIVAPRIKVRPGQEKTCPIPKPLLVPPTPVVCDEFDPNI